MRNYEFRIHAGHVNNFDKFARLLIRYGDVGPVQPELRGPGTGITNQPATYAMAQWCGEVGDFTRPREFRGLVERVGTAGPGGLTISLYSGPTETTGILLGSTTNAADGTYFSAIRQCRQIVR